MTELAMAKAELDAAFARYRAALKESCRALLAAGFRPTVINDDLRLEVMLEAAREEAIDL